MTDAAGSELGDADGFSDGDGETSADGDGDGLSDGDGLGEGDGSLLTPRVAVKINRSTLNSRLVCRVAYPEAVTIIA
jgi:hypothetical protein